MYLTKIGRDCSFFVLQIQLLLFIYIQFKLLFTFSTSFVTTNMNALIPYGLQELEPEPEELRSVPSNLLPTDTRSLNQEWAEQTFRYAYMFGRQFGSSDWGDQAKIQAWIDTGIKLQQELREIGVKKAHDKILSVFREYNVCLPGTNQRPTNFDDVIVIINDKQWYAVQQESKQQLIHMITYGIFRSGYNHWAIKASKEWLSKHKLKLDDREMLHETVQDKTTRRKKGFAYTNLVQRASNSIADRIQKNMITNHGHYISVRKKSKGEKNANFQYEKKRFNAFDAYIVYPDDNLLEIMTPKEQYKKKINDLVALALKNDVQYDEIIQIVQGCIYNIDDKLAGKTDVSCICYYFISLTFENIMYCRL